STNRAGRISKPPPSATRPPLQRTAWTGIIVTVRTEFVDVLCSRECTSEYAKKARYQKRLAFFDVVNVEIIIATRLQPDRKLQFGSAGETQISWDINCALRM